MQNQGLHFQKGDFAAIAAVLLLAAAVFASFLPASRTSAASAEVYLAGELVRTVSLQEDTSFAVTGEYTNTVTVQNGKIAVTESDCPGADCVNCGWADTSGKSIVCLPNGLEIRVKAADGDVDFVVR